MLSDNDNLPTKPSESTGEQLPVEDRVISNENIADNTGLVSEETLLREESVAFEFHSSIDGDGPHRLDLQTPDREASLAKDWAAPDNINSEEYTELLQQLSEERAKAVEHSEQLQMQLAEFLRKKSAEDQDLQRTLPGSEQLDSYECCLKVLTELKQQLEVYSDTAEQQTVELRLQAQEKLHKVDREWRELMALKKDMAVMMLSRRLGKAAAQAKVESTLETEQRQQDELTRLRLQNIRLKDRICRLESELREAEQRAGNPLQLQYEQLQIQRLKCKNYTEKQTVEALKVQRKMSRSLELLSNIKEKLYWTELEVQNKREQLAQVDAMVTRKRDVLTSIKQERNSLKRDNQKLKERRGLLGNTALLRDFDDTTHACAHLEEKLENLRCRQADLDFFLGRRKKRLETI